MGAHYGFGKTVNKGLVFAYDTGDVLNSYRGEPTENLIALGGTDPEVERSGTSYPYYSTNITSLVQSRWSTSNNLITMSFEGKRDYVDGGTGGGNDGYPRMYVYFSDWSWSRSFGTGAYDWEYVANTGAMPDPTGKSVYFAIYHMNSGNRGRSYSRRHQVELKPHATPFVNGTRSATQGLLDLTGNRDLSLANVSFDSNAQIVFDGTDDMIELANNPQEGSNSVSWEFVVNFDLVHDNETSTYRQLYIQESSVWIGQYYDYIGIDIGKDDGSWFDGNGGRVTNSKIGPVNSGQYYHAVFTWDGVNVKGYLNGELGFTTAISGLTGIRTGSTPRRIGRRSGQPLAGDMPITRLYNSALTAAEVKQNFNHYKTRFSI